MADPKPVIIVEPSAVKAAEIAKGYEIISAAQNDLDLRGRRVILWPDATPESRALFKSLAERISDQCEELKIIVPNGRPHGWNIATAVAGGETWDHLAKWAKVSMMVFPKGALSVSVETHEAPDEVPDDVEAIWDRCGIARNKSGIIYNVDNVVRLLSGWPKFKDMVWYDDFYGRYFTVTKGKVREWGDIDDINLTVLLQHDFGMPKLHTATVSEAIQCRGHQCHRNEPKDWMERLKWDGKPRLDTFFHDYMGSGDSGYHAAVSRNFWIGMIARIWQPGCQLDNMVILEGRQGIFKSKALEAIGGKWYMEAAEELTSKDFFVALAGKLIIEIADLDSFSRADTNRIKKVITCRVDRYRQPYGRSSQDHPRRSIFVGTTNEQHYLRDNTGARRFWPITCGAIALDRIREDREQLFAEAVTRYIAGEDWYKVPNEAAIEQQEDRRQYDELEEPVLVYTNESCQHEFTLIEIGAALGIDKPHLDTPMQKRLGSIMRRLGYVSRVIQRDGQSIRRWVKPQPISGTGQLPLSPPIEPLPLTA